MVPFVTSQSDLFGLPFITVPDKICGANMGSIWGRQYPGGPRVGPMNFAIWVAKSNIMLDMTVLWWASVV